MNEITMIRTGALFPHPENPRKDLGDLTELTESIKKHGVMQNLTVYPFETVYGATRYRVLIGHRRLAAAKEAGIQELPCRVIDKPDRKTQLTIMLEENMQRNDLTLVEQAESFQLMLDLGGSVKDIVEKTGFSESTVYHRLNIAKLDKKALTKAMQHEDFQLSLSDFYALEAIEDVKERNRILSEAKDPGNLRWMAKQAVIDEQKKRNEQAVMKMLKDAGIPRLPKEKENSLWNLCYDEIQSFDLMKAPGKLKYKYDPADTDVFSTKRYGNVLIIRLKKKNVPQKSEVEIESNRKRQHFQQVSKIIKEEVREFLLSGEIPDGTVSDLRDLFLETCSTYYVYASSQIKGYISGSREYYSMSDEEKEKADKVMNGMSFRKILLISQAISAFSASLQYDHRREDAKAFIDRLKPFGFSFADRDGIGTDEITSVFDGTHEFLKDGR